MGKIVPRRSAKIRKKSNLSDATIGLGSPILLNRGQIKSIAKATVCLLHRLREEKNEKILHDYIQSRQMVRDSLYSFAIEYFYELSVDNRVTSRELKEDVDRLASHMYNLCKCVSEIPRPTLVTIKHNMPPLCINKKSLDDILEDLQLARKGIKFSCKKLRHEKSKKTARVSNYKACQKLWILRESLTGKSFKRSWGAGNIENDGRWGRSGYEFIAGDALFVQIALHSLNPAVLQSEVRTSLKAVAKAHPKSKRPQNGPAILP